MDSTGHVLYLPLIKAMDAVVMHSKQLMLIGAELHVVVKWL